MSKQEDDAWVLQVIENLQALLSREDAPVEDIDWLLLRCQDTLRYTCDWDDWRRASTRQLIKDLASFEKDFPGLLPQDLLLGPISKPSDG